ncbi:MAG: hypothetical protein CHACPFDD_01269 [Phycisphaerae bacterium]|nr:hypothetical protein [Phycisphaerae bacterium]
MFRTPGTANRRHHAHGGFSRPALACGVLAGALPLLCLTIAAPLLGCAALTRALPPVEAGETVAGLDYRYYEGRWRSIPDLDKLQPAASGHSEALDISAGRRGDDFALRFNGFFEAPKTGVYTFRLRADDGACVRIGDRCVVACNCGRCACFCTGDVHLKQGTHPIEVTYVERDGPEALELWYEGPGISRQPVPASALTRPDQGDGGE